HRLPFSPNLDRKRWFPTVTAHFSPLQTPPRLEHLSTAESRAQLTNWLRDAMVLQKFEAEMAFGPAILPEAILETARANPRHPVLEDVSERVDYRRMLIGADLFGAQFRRRLAQDRRPVGVLLPNVNATPLVLLGLWFNGHVPALLNYSTGAATMLACVQLAGIKQVITSRVFLDRARLKLDLLTDAGVE